MNIIDVTPANVETEGFFCKMSQRKSPGYKRKLSWLLERFDEGLKIKKLDLRMGGRGFIEYLPGNYAWRAVFALDYLFIHCLWVVGQSKGKGFAKLLLDECEREALTSEKIGVAVLTSQGNWLISREFFLRQGYITAAESPPGFSLLYKQMRDGQPPSMPTDWNDRAARFGKTVTVIRTDQCPYLDDASETVRKSALEAGFGFNEVHFSSAVQIRSSAPSPYGVFTILHKGKVISHYYQLPKDLPRLLKN